MQNFELRDHVVESLQEEKKRFIQGLKLMYSKK